MKTEQQDAVEAAVSMDAIIGRRVHHLMWDRHMTQTSLGERLGMSQTGVARKLRGQRGWTTDEIVLVANVLEVTPGYLFGDGEDTAPEGPNGGTSDYSSDVPNVVTMAEWLAARATA